MLRVAPHYQVFKIESMAELRELFPPSVDYGLNWLLLATSGVHGHYGTLDDAQACLEDRCEWRADPEHEHDNTITVLVVQPRLVCTRYGTIEIAAEDIPWLRETVRQSLAGIVASQDGNLPRET